MQAILKAKEWKKRLNRITVGLKHRMHITELHQVSEFKSNHSGIETSIIRKMFNLWERLNRITVGLKLIFAPLINLIYHCLNRITVGLKQL